MCVCVGGGGRRGGGGGGGVACAAKQAPFSLVYVLSLFFCLFALSAYIFIKENDSLYISIFYQ